MSDRDFGKTLKKSREKASITVQQVSDILISKGFRATKNTIYSWENNNSQPTPDALLELCILYKIDNVLEAFGYNNTDERLANAITITDDPHKKSIAKYLKLNKEHQANVRGMIDAYAVEEQESEKRASDTEFVNEPA